MSAEYFFNNCNAWMGSLQRIIICAPRTLLHIRHADLSCCGISYPRRTFATTSPRDEANQRNGSVAVLGGGITGLASAYYLAQQLPQSQITLFERSSRLGGWLRSTQVDVGSGKVVFEQGPRSIRPSRPNGWVTLDLVSIAVMGNMNC